MKRSYRFQNSIFKILILFLFIVSLGRENIYGNESPLGKDSENFTTGDHIAKKFGVHEIVFKSDKKTANPFNIACTVTFNPPSGKYPVKVNAFYDGDGLWRARLYVIETGIWNWKSECSELRDLNGRNGKFNAVESNLRGMLRKDPANPKQWITENGKWFLNINDTGYLLFNSTEKEWKQYIKDLALLGVTSVRAGALGGDAWDKNSQANQYQIKVYPQSREDDCPWDENDRSKMNLERFKTTDERLIWMLNNYPEMYVQLILFGLNTSNSDDSGQLWKAVPQEIRNNTMKYMIARWSAFPQLFYQVVNDMHCSEKFPNNQAYIREVGHYFASHDPWHHLLSTGPNRYQTFPFTTKEDLEWVSYIYIEDSESLDAKMISLYEKLPLHVFMGEDRYEQYLMDECNYILFNPEYYNRWMFWSWTLSGGSANYGGRWGRVHPYFSTDSLLYIEPGDSTGKTKYNSQLKGLNSVKYIGQFFRNRNITLSEFQPDHNLAKDLSNKEGNGYLKLMRKGNEEFILYHPNALKKGANTLIDKDNTVHIQLDLGQSNSDFNVEWYRPDKGESFNGGVIKGNANAELKAPWKGTDAVLHLKKKI